MMLITVSSNKPGKLSISLKTFSFFTVLLFSSVLNSAPSFTLGANKLDLAQPGANDMVSVDFNNDNINDVLISEYFSGDGTAAIELRFGNSSGLFDLSTTLLRLPTGGDGLFFNPGGLDVGFINNDNIIDIAVTAGLTPESGANPAKPENLQTYIFTGMLSANGGYSIRRTNSTAIQTLYSPKDVAIGNFNNDAFMDVVIAHNMGFSLFLGTANGVFSTTELLVITTGQNLSPSEIYARDLNGDGFLDIVTDRAVYFNDNSTINSTRNSFTRKVAYTAILSATGMTNIAAVTVADFNADSVLDIAYAVNDRANSTSQVVTMLSAGSGATVSYSQSTIPKLINSTLSDISTADVDLDGVIDIVVSDDMQSVIHVYAGFGNGGFSTPVSSSLIPTAALAIPPLPKLLEILKVNNDNLLDVVTANEASSGVITPTFSVLTQTAPAMESYVFGPQRYSVPVPAQALANLPITVLRKYTNSTATTLTYTVIEGSARNGTDYNATAGASTINFAAGDLSQIINISILATATIGKSFTIALSDAAGAVVDTATITIQGAGGSTALPIISLSRNSYTRFEDQGRPVVRVIATRTPVTSNTTTTVYLTTQDLTGPATARKNLDYIPITRQSLITPNLVFTGMQTKTNLLIPIRIIDDSLIEGIETFRVNLSSPSNGILSATSTSAAIVIIDNDSIGASGNAIPVTIADSYTANKNIALSISAVNGVLKNDTDAEGAILSAKLAPGSTLIGLRLQSNGSFTYQPAANFTGVVTFNYIANDGRADSAPATVTITVSNAIPIASADSYTILKNQTLVIPAPGILSNDSDINNDTLTSSLALGSTLAGLTLSQDGSFSYLPAQNLSGVVTFDYVASDGMQASLPVTVTINVNNSIPVANSDNFSTQMDTTLVIPAPGVLSNDSDGDNDNLIAKLVTASALPGLTFNQDGSFAYVPTAGITGKVSFQYSSNDGIVDSPPTTVTIDVFDPVQLASGVFSFSTVNSYRISEQRSELILFVVRDTGSTGVVTLNYSLKDITATTGIDFSDKTKTVNTLVFNDGVSSLSIIIGIVKDAVTEPDEEFLISLESVSSGVLANSNISRKVVITDSTNTITPNSNPSNNNGGGGCTLQINSRFDPTLPLLVFLAILYFARRRLVMEVRSNRKKVKTLVRLMRNLSENNLN